MTESINVILAALAAVAVSGSQAAVSDLVKEALEHFMQHIRQKFTGQHKALMVLDAYRSDPATWEKPLKELLLQSGLAQDTTTVDLARRILDLTDSQPNQRDHFHIQHFGPGQGNVYGSNYGTITVNPGENKVVKGKVAVMRGKEALWRGEYDVARHLLNEALESLAENHSPAEAAQSRYLLVLALLNGQRPSRATYQTLCRIDHLLRAAITLHPARSYLYLLSLVKWDYARHGFSHFTDEARELLERMQHTPLSAQDQDNLQLLAQCQPRLLQDAQQWWEDDQQAAQPPHSIKHSR
jgi:tetratricopeptide (TPR) repeat protein